METWKLALMNMSGDGAVQLLKEGYHSLTKIQLPKDSGIILLWDIAQLHVGNGRHARMRIMSSPRCNYLLDQEVRLLRGNGGSTSGSYINDAMLDCSGFCQLKDLSE